MAEWNGMVSDIEVMVTRTEVMASWDPPARFFRLAFEDGSEVQLTANGKAMEALKGLKEWRIHDLEVAIVGKQ